MDPVILALLISATGVIVNIWAVNNAVNKGNVENAKQTGAILQSISDMRSDIDSFKADIKEQRLAFTNLSDRVTKLEGYATNDYEKIYHDLEPRVKKLEEKI